MKAIDYAAFSVVLVAGVGVGHYVAKAVHERSTTEDANTLLWMGAFTLGAAGAAYLLDVKQKTVADVIAK